MNPIEAFVNVASGYCTVIDGYADHSAEQFLDQVRKNLSLLYHHALGLPECETNESGIALSAEHDDWKTVRDGIAELLGCNNAYWQIFDPIQETPSGPVVSAISDDLADIWGDLVRGVALWPTASECEQRDIVWHWRFMFQYHWSNHVVDAMRAINWVAESYGVRDSDETS